MNSNYFYVNFYFSIETCSEESSFWIVRNDQVKQGMMTQSGISRSPIEDRNEKRRIAWFWKKSGKLGVARKVLTFVGRTSVRVK